MSVQLFHRFGAAVLATFILAHLGVHLTALAGPQTHAEALDLMRTAYRHPVAEAILLLVIASQVATGLWKLVKSKGGKGWARAQVLSGAYLAMFLLVHSGAAVTTHTVAGLDTNFFWAAGSLHYDPIRTGFAVYYLLAVIAFFTHLGAALHYAGPARLKPAARLVPVVGAIIGGIIIATFAGAFYSIDIPSDVAAYYHGNFGFLGVGKPEVAP